MPSGRMTTRPWSRPTRRRRARARRRRSRSGIPSASPPSTGRETRSALRQRGVHVRAIDARPRRSARRRAFAGARRACAGGGRRGRRRRRRGRRCPSCARGGRPRTTPTPPPRLVAADRRRHAVGAVDRSLIAGNAETSTWTRCRGARDRRRGVGGVAGQHQLTEASSASSPPARASSPRRMS